MSTRFRAPLLLALALSTLPLAAMPAQAATPDTAVVIVFKDTVAPRAAARALQATYGLVPGFVYEHALRGMSAAVPAGRLAALQRDPRVDFVQADRPYSISEQTTPNGIKRVFGDSEALRGVSAVDDRRVDVDVAVIDTGIDLRHPDLNVAGGVTCTSGKWWAPPTCTTGGADDHSHGTHVAGTIAALDNGVGVVGVAPGARLWAVKVLNSSGSGYTSWIVAGIDWVAAHADTIEVANMSLGGSGYDAAEYRAIQGAVSQGVAFAVAAGNSGANAANYSPASFDNVLAVSALADSDGLPGSAGGTACTGDTDDTLAYFSNYGAVVDIAAPGVCVYSTVPGGYGTMSGTSMASPHVAGALALAASTASSTNTQADVTALYDAVTAAGNDGWTDTSPDGIREPLLDVSSFTPALIDVRYLRVVSLTPVASWSGTTWRVSLTVTVKDALQAGVPGVLVNGSWSAGTKVNSCTTGAEGTCTVSVTGLSTKTRSVTYTVSTVTATGWTWDKAGSVTSVKVPRP